MALYLAGPAEVVGTSVLAGLVLAAHRKNLVTEMSLLLDRRNVQLKHDPPEL
jgi:hypothetical protein